MKILRLANLVKEGEAELDVDLCDDVGIKVEVDGCTIPDNAACATVWSILWRQSKDDCLTSRNLCTDCTVQ
jgi:hypothetical protein